MAPTSTNPPPPASSSPQYDLEAMQASPEAVETQQPGAHQAMDVQRSHPEEPEMNLRGGDGRGPCPGRFCFIIPCPIPINCCIFPCPC